LSAPTDNQIYALAANQFSPSPGTTLVKINKGQQKIKIVCTNQQSNLPTPLPANQFSPSAGTTLVFEQQNINNRAVTPLNFDKAKGAAMAPDTLLIKLPMGTVSLLFIRGLQKLKTARVGYNI